MRHEAIYSLYSSVVAIDGNGDNAVAKDADGNTVNWDATAVAKIGRASCRERV